MRELERKRILLKVLSKGAFERLSHVKLVKPELAKQLEDYIIALYIQKKIRNITEEQIKAILEALGRKKKFRILK